MHTGTDTQFARELCEQTQLARHGAGKTIGVWVIGRCISQKPVDILNHRQRTPACLAMLTQHTHAGLINPPTTTSNACTKAPDAVYEQVKRVMKSIDFFWKRRGSLKGGVVHSKPYGNEGRIAL